MKICSIERTPVGVPKSEVAQKIEPKNFDFNDPRIMKTVFWDGNMTGIFQVTSTGMEKLFQRVKPTCFDDVAAIAALYRPGPLGSGMPAMFARRKNGEEEVTYDHPILEEIMRDTYGCLVYQEQMLEIGRRLGQMSWKDTNRLRKLFLKKDKSKQDDFIEKEERELKALLIAGCVANGLSVEKGEELWEMCGRFGGYGFNASHAKAYGMVTMQTAYLRTYHPMEFFAALLSVGQASELQSYVNDIRRQGFKILPVDINSSGRAHIIEGDGIRLSLLSVDKVGPAAVDKLLAEREANGPFESLLDFVTRKGATKAVCESLIRVGAFQDLEPQVSLSTQMLRHGLWFGKENKKLQSVKCRPELEERWTALWGKKDDPIEMMLAERELLGFNLRMSPFSLNGRAEKVRRLFEEGLCRPLREFMEDEEAAVLITPLMLRSFSEKPQRKGGMMAFLTFTDPDGQEVEAPAFAGVWKYLSGKVRVGEVYVCTLNRKEEDPTRFIFGRPGWAQNENSASSALLRLDDMTI